MKQIKWSKKLFRCTIELISNGIKVGQLKDNEFTNSAVGYLNEKQYAFKMNWWGHHTKIIDLSKGERVGHIKFGWWLPNATIDYDGLTAQWKFSNILEKKWQVSGKEGTKLKSTGWQGSGAVEILYPNELLVLSGIYISNYYWKMAGVYAAIMLPLFLLIL